jgi:hypothetical protein
MNKSEFPLCIDCHYFKEVTPKDYKCRRDISVVTGEIVEYLCSMERQEPLGKCGLTGRFWKQKEKEVV